MKKLAVFTLLAATLALGTGAARAANISGPLTNTLTITDPINTFVDNVTCTMVAIPCISFGAPNIALNLNGFTMTDMNGSRDSCPSSNTLPNEIGITTNGQDGATIQGPGLIRRFRGTGILVTGNTSTVDSVVVASTCINGIEVGGNGSQVTNNTVVRASLSGLFYVGIAAEGSGGHTIQGNIVVGESNPIAGCTSFPCTIPASKGGHGIFVAAASLGNTIQANTVSGNPGAGIFLGTGTTGNMITNNAAFGNIAFHDIFDPNAAGANTYTGNTCEVSGGAGAPTCPGL